MIAAGKVPRKAPKQPQPHPPVCWLAAVRRAPRPGSAVEAPAGGRDAEAGGFQRRGLNRPGPTGWGRGGVSTGIVSIARGGRALLCPEACRQNGPSRARCPSVRVRGVARSGVSPLAPCKRLRPGCFRRIKGSLRCSRGHRIAAAKVLRGLRPPPGARGVCDSLPSAQSARGAPNTPTCVCRRPRTVIIRMDFPAMTTSEGWR
jgi:hypothetical protein